MRIWNFTFGWLMLACRTSERLRKAMGRRREQTVLLLCILSFWATIEAAEDEVTVEDETEAAQIPNIQLLEFLGQFETETGQWMDPESLISDEFELFLEAAEQSENSDSNNQQRNRQ